MRKRKRVKFDRSRCYRTLTWWRDAIIHRPHTPSEGFWNVRHVSLGNLEELTTSSSECCHWLWHWFWVQCYLIKTLLHSGEILIWSSLSLLHKTDMLSVKSRLHQYIESFTCYINTMIQKTVKSKRKGQLCTCWETKMVLFPRFFPG